MPACVFGAAQAIPRATLPMFLRVGFAASQHVCRPEQPEAGDQQHQLQQKQLQSSKQQPVWKLYKSKWIVPVRFLVRAKVFQLLGGGSIGLILAGITMQQVAIGDIVALSALAGGMVAASCCLWYYSRRYVGEMGLLLPDRRHVRFSVLDFWGNREDNDIPLDKLVPPFKDVRPKEIQRIASQLLFPLNVTGDRQYYLSIQAGNILEPQVLFSILKGEYDPKQTPDQQQGFVQQMAAADLNSKSTRTVSQQQQQ
eukprot:GHRR01024876.1.p1 GENE.GHRR01024876.1~~GHRR01024876.1.p1  ORF type:complete len:254 (+),score=101.27 GHRR01024876.1:409-1170(+)